MRKFVLGMKLLLPPGGFLAFFQPPSSCLQRGTQNPTLRVSRGGGTWLPSWVRRPAREWGGGSKAGLGGYIPKQGCGWGGGFSQPNLPIHHWAGSTRCDHSST